MLQIVLNIWKDVFQIISRETWFKNQKMLIHIDSSGFRYV